MGSPLQALTLHHLWLEAMLTTEAALALGLIYEQSRFPPVPVGALPFSVTQATSSHA